MFKNYLKTALRNLKRNKSYAVINVLGLAVGIAACLLIFLVIQFETSFDNFHKKRNQIYRVGSEFHTQDGLEHSAGVSFPVANALRIDFPQIKEVASILKIGDEQLTIINNNTDQLKKFSADYYFAEPQFFNMFDFGWLEGNPKISLTGPNNAILTQEMAEKYFGDWHNAIGKSIMRNNDEKQVFKISGIFKNPPANTDFPIGVVVSYSTLANTRMKRNMDDWISTFGQAYTFVVLPENYPVSKFNNDLKAFAK